MDPSITVPRSDHRKAMEANTLLQRVVQICADGRAQRFEEKKINCSPSPPPSPSFCFWTPNKPLGATQSAWQELANGVQAFARPCLRHEKLLEGIAERLLLLRRGAVLALRLWRRVGWISASHIFSSFFCRILACVLIMYTFNMYIYIDRHIHIFVYIYIYMCIDTPLYIYIFVHVNIYVCELNF